MSTLLFINHKFNFEQVLCEYYFLVEKYSVNIEKDLKQRFSHFEILVSCYESLSSESRGRQVGRRTDRHDTKEKTQQQSKREKETQNI